MTDTTVKTMHAILRDPFGTIVAEGDLELSPDVPVMTGESEAPLTWHDQLRELLPATRMQLIGSAPNTQLLFDLQVSFNG